jgi:hypothetical protein
MMGRCEFSPIKLPTQLLSAAISLQQFDTDIATNVIYQRSYHLVS